MTDRELDALVAEKVMGYAKSFCNKDTGTQYFNNGGGSFRFNPATDISAAWEVVEKVSQFSIDKTGISKVWACRFWFNDCFVSARADTAPRAICLAALKAVE